MENLRKVCAAALLILVISLTALAGDMSCGITDPPPQQSQAVTTGDMSAGITATDNTTEDEVAVASPITETMLNIVQSVLALF